MPKNFIREFMVQRIVILLKFLLLLVVSLIISLLSTIYVLKDCKIRV